jgi:hypothetical protein
MKLIAYLRLITRWIYTFSSPYVFMTFSLIKHWDRLTLTFAESGNSNIFIVSVGCVLRFFFLRNFLYINKCHVKFQNLQNGFDHSISERQNEELNALYFSPNTLRVIKSRRMSQAGHVACIGERRCVYKVFGGET